MNLIFWGCENRPDNPIIAVVWSVFFLNEQNVFLILMNCYLSKKIQNLNHYEIFYSMHIIFFGYRLSLFTNILFIFKLWKYRNEIKKIILCQFWTKFMSLCNVESIYALCWALYAVWSLWTLLKCSKRLLKSTFEFFRSLVGTILKLQFMISA